MSVQKTAIVTGAARGIGLATTQAFLAEGRRVAMIDRDGPALMAAAAELRDVVPMLCDVSEPDQVDATVAEVTRAFGHLPCAWSMEHPRPGASI